MFKATVAGNVTADLDLREATVSGEKRFVSEFTVASNKIGKRDETDFVRVTVWGGLAETCAKHLKKGSAVVVVGSCTTEGYINDKSEAVSYAKITNVDDIQFMDRK